MLAAGLVRWKLIASFLGPQGMGIAGVIDPTAQLAVHLGSLNIPTAALRFLPIAQDERGTPGVAWLYGTFLRVLVASTAILAAIGMTVVFVWPRSLGVGTANNAAVALALAAAPLMAATHLLRNVLATLRRFRAAAMAMFVSSALLVLGCFLGIRYGGLTGAYISGLLVAALTVAWLHEMVTATLRAAPATRSGSLVGLLRAHPDIVRFSLTLYAIGFAVPVGYWVARWTVLGYLGAREAGFLAAAYAVAAGVRTVFSQAGAQYLVPLASRNLAADARAAEAARYIRTLMLLLLVAALPLVLFPRELILLLFSPAFLPAIATIGFFILSEAILAIGDAYRVLLLGLNDLRACLVISFSGAAVVVTGVWWMVPHLGLPGIALLHLATGLLVLAWAIGRLRARHNIRVDVRSIGMTAYFCGALAMGALIGRTWPLSSLDWIGAKAAIGLALVLFGARLMPQHERRAMLRARIGHP